MVNITDNGNTGTGGALVAVGRVPISVSPVNDPPEIRINPNGFGLLPAGGALGTEEDVPLSLELVSINDKEMSAGSGGRLTVSLQCSNGGLTVRLDDSDGDGQGAATGVTWAVGGEAESAGTGPWQAVVFSGELADTNRVLSKLNYMPRSDWHGVDDLNVS